MTSQGHYELTIDLDEFEGHTRYALYKRFSLSSEHEYFRLVLANTVVMQISTAIHY